MCELPRTLNSFTGASVFVSVKESCERASIIVAMVPKLSAGYPFITINTPFQMSGNYFANNCPNRRAPSMVLYYSIILVSTF